MIGTAKWQKEAKKKLEQTFLSPIFKLAEINWPDGNRTLQQYHQAFLIDLEYQIYMDYLLYYKQTFIQKQWSYFLIRRLGTFGLLKKHQQHQQKQQEGEEDDQPLHSFHNMLLPLHQNEEKWLDYLQNQWFQGFPTLIFIDYIIQLNNNSYDIDDVLKLDASCSLCHMFTMVSVK